MRALMLGLSALLLALSVHTYGMSGDTLNSGAYVDLGGPYCVGVELSGNPGPFWYLPWDADGGSNASCS